MARKAKIDKDGYVHFLNDNDGLSTKDYLLLISTIVFFGFITVGLVLLLFNKTIDPMYIELLGMVTTPLASIVIGVMGVNTMEVYTNKKNNKVIEEDVNSQEDIV